ncbi:MAG: response regulator [Bacteroidota bacterium]
MAVLEDQLDELALVAATLQRYGFEVHAYRDGTEAMEEIRANPHIAALITDIQLKDADGFIRYPQGYDVADELQRAFRQAGRPFRVFVMTGLSSRQALRELNYFAEPVDTIEKGVLLEGAQESGGEELVEFIDKLNALRLAEADRFLKDLKATHERSRWLTVGYWEVYRAYAGTHDWDAREASVGARAAAIVDRYQAGEVLSLRGSSGPLTLRDRYTLEQFEDFLVGRRVVYALRLLHPDHWKALVLGKSVSLPAAPNLDAAVSDALDPRPKSLVRYLMEGYVRLQGEQNPRERAKLVANQEARAQELEVALSRSHPSLLPVISPNLALWRSPPPPVTLCALSTEELRNVRQWVNSLCIRQKDMCGKDRTAPVSEWKHVLQEERAWLADLPAVFH